MTKTLFVLVALLSLLGNASGFVVVTPHQPQLGRLAAAPREQSTADEIDFDAPPQRADAVGNAVHSPEAKIGFGDFSVPVPHFLAKAFGMTDRRSESSSTMEQLNEPAFFADDECYMGKEGNFDECVDFDPQHKASP